MRETLAGFLAVVGVLLGIAGVVLLFFPTAISFYGPILIWAGVLAFAGAAISEALVLLVPAVVCVVGLALVVSSFIALGMRNFTADSYRYHYGDKVTAEGACPEEEQSERVVVRRRRGNWDDDSQMCPATWTFAGRKVEGQANLSDAEVIGLPQDRRFSVTAYAIGDTASSAGLDNLDPEYGVMRYAGIPLGTAGRGALVFVAGLLMAGILSLVSSRRQTSARLRDPSRS